ncbi:MAG: hypothetical protein EXR65_05220 [Dehalococcoidia bacterium]|nr:hypothetical protein [Dehalococcoidia bacterium]
MAELSPAHRAAVQLLAAWMSERYFRTFRRFDGDPVAFDALLVQRERRVGVTVGALWDDAAPVAGAAALAALLTEDLAGGGGEAGGYAVWVPPGVTLPAGEPQRSDLRVALAKALAGLAPGDRREVRLPVTLHLAKLQDDGAYVSVAGGLAAEWTALSEGVHGAYHLDARAVHRLPDERAEVELIVSRVRDRAAVLRSEEVTDVPVHDTWSVSRLPAGAAAGVAVVAAPPDLDPLDGAMVRRMLRRHVQRAAAQRAAAEGAAGPPELTALVVIVAVAHLEQELATAALRGMSPAAYGSVDLITVAGDGGMRQVLQPRSLPWSEPRAV